MNKNKISLLNELTTPNVLFMIYALICVDKMLLNGWILSKYSSFVFTSMMLTTICIIGSMGIITKALAHIPKVWARKWIWDTIRQPVCSILILSTFVYCTDKTFFNGWVANSFTHGGSGPFIGTIIVIIMGSIIGLCMTGTPLYSDIAKAKATGIGTSYEYVGSTTWVENRATLTSPIGNISVMQRSEPFDENADYYLKNDYCFFGNKTSEQY